MLAGTSKHHKLEPRQHIPLQLNDFSKHSTLVNLCYAFYLLLLFDYTKCLLKLLEILNTQPTPAPLESEDWLEPPNSRLLFWFGAGDQFQLLSIAMGTMTRVADARVLVAPTLCLITSMLAANSTFVFEFKLNIYSKFTFFRFSCFNKLRGGFFSVVFVLRRESILEQY